MARITLKQWRQDEGLLTKDELHERLIELSIDSVCPALCDEGCEVEPNGRCEHDCPSVLIAMGLI